MSIQIVAEVLGLPTDVAGTRRLVLIALANHADGDTRECWPSIATIAAEAGVYPDTARKALRQLEGDGLIERVTNAAPDARIPAHRRPNLYRLNLAVGGSNRQGGSNQPPVSIEPQWGGRSSRNGGVESTHQNVSEPSVNRQSCDPQLFEAPEPEKPDPAEGKPRRESRRRRDELFEAVIEATVGPLEEYNPPKSERSGHNRVVKELREVGATPDDVRARARQYRRLYQGAELTPHALLNQWSKCAAPADRAGPQMSSWEHEEARRKAREAYWAEARERQNREAAQ